MERGPTVTWSPSLRSGASAVAAGSWLSISACHTAPGRVAGSVKPSGSHHALTMTRKSSSIISVPSSARSGSSDPSR